MERRIETKQRRNESRQRRIDTLQKHVDKLAAALEKSRRAGKRQAAPFSKGKPKAEPKKPGRKPGKDYGRAGRRAIPRRVDEVLDAPLPTRYADCQGAAVEKQYQTEIPPVKPLVRAFDVHVGHCESCGKGFQGRHPHQTSDALGTAVSQLGPRVVASPVLDSSASSRDMRKGRTTWGAPFVGASAGSRGPRG